MKVGTSAIENVKSQKVFSIESDKRVFVIGDLDGDLDPLKNALDHIAFDPQFDHLFCLGDVIDRGKQSYSLFQYLEGVGAHIILGNHEHLMLESIMANDKEALSIWNKNGGTWHLSVDDDELLSMCNKLLSKTLSILLNYRGHRVALSHTLPQTWDWHNYPTNKTKLIESLLWNRDVMNTRRLVKNTGADFSIHGHTSTQIPLWISNSYHIDTKYYGMLTLVELGTIIQSNQDCDTAPVF